MAWRFRYLIAVCGLIALAPAFWLLLPASDASVSHRRVLQRLEQPIGAEPLDALGLAGRARVRWSAEDIDRDWTRVASGERMTFRSPRLDIPPDLYSIVVSFASASPAGSEPPLLLWSSTPALDGTDFSRNRRELHAIPGLAVSIVRGDSLQTDVQAPIRYLFLHLPDPLARARVDGIAIVTAADLAATARPSTVRLTLDGEVRPVAITQGSRTIAYQAAVPAHTTLAFGVRLAAPSPAGVLLRVTQTSASRTLILEETTVHDRSWRDVVLPLSPSPSATITFTTVAPADVAVYRSTPMLLGPGERPRRANVIVYVMDALRADKLGLYGGRPGASPFLDTLGERSLVFRRAYAAASWTKPSVATLLTSLYPQTHGLGSRYYSDPLPDSVPTLQGLLSEAGYVTAQFSANAFTGTLSNLDRGFDQSFMPDALMRNSQAGGLLKAESRGFAISARDLNDHVFPWLDRHRDDRFLLYLHAVDTHPPFRDGADAPNPQAAYEHAVLAADQDLARLYRRLQDLGLADDTLLVVTADHGEAFGEHGRTGHGQSVYDEEIRVPLIVHAPARIAAGVVEEPVHLVDVMPTVLDYCGALPAPGLLQGRSLLPHAGSAPRSSPVVVSRFVYPDDLDKASSLDRAEAYAVVDYPWKLIAIDRPGSQRVLELYHLDRDPREQQNVAAAESVRARRLEAALRDFTREQALARSRFSRTHSAAAGMAPQQPDGTLLQHLRSLGYIY